MCRVTEDYLLCEQCAHNGRKGPRCDCGSYYCKCLYCITQVEVYDAKRRLYDVVPRGAAVDICKDKQMVDVFIDALLRADSIDVVRKLIFGKGGIYYRDYTCHYVRIIALPYTRKIFASSGRANIIKFLIDECDTVQFDAEDLQRAGATVLVSLGK